MLDDNFDEVQKVLKYTFNDKSLLKKALTLASYDSVNNNQSFEFFGDAILEFIVSESLFSLQENDEGELTKRRANLVADSSLTPISKKLHLDEFLQRGKNDNKNKKAIPSAYEAVVAAIYLDGGMDAARQFVLSTLDFSKTLNEDNYKGRLQEVFQAKGEPIPEYLNKDVGNAQTHKFQVKLSVFGQVFIGVADSIKHAEQLAAKSALEYYEKQNK